VFLCVLVFGTIAWAELGHRCTSRPMPNRRPPPVVFSRRSALRHAPVPRIGRRARKPLVGMEPLRRREQRRPYLEGEAAVRARWMVTVLSGVMLALGRLPWNPLGVQ